MLERLWSGWRSSYVTASSSDAPTGGDGSDDARSVFTALLESGLPDEETHIVARSSTCFVVVNVYPYTTGHVLVVPYREVPDLLDLSADERADLWATVTRAVEVVRAAYAPDGLNVGLNLGRPAGGTVPNHLHVHVVPRWVGDTNFMSVVANTQTLPESLAASVGRLRAAWEAGGRQ